MARERGAGGSIIRGSDPQAWPTKYKHGIVFARNREISSIYCGSVTKILPYGSTHPAPPLQRVLETAYYEDIVKPVHKATNPRKHRTRNTNWRARLKLKQNDDCLSEELQSSVLPGPRCGPVGGRRLKSGLFNRYVIVGISEAFGVTIKKSRVLWHMIVLSIIARHSAQSVADSSWRKIREKDAADSRKKRLGYSASCHTL